MLFAYLEFYIAAAWDSINIAKCNLNISILNYLFGASKNAGMMLLVLLLFILSIQLTAESEDWDHFQEYEVKAAFIYNLAKFTEWPDQSDLFHEDSTIVIGILGDDPFGFSIEKVIGGKTVRGRVIQVKRFQSIEEIQSCQVLFISRSEDSNLSHILPVLQSMSVLTVSDLSEFNRSGGMVRFFIEQNKIRLAINVEAVERAHLKISSKLLSLAKIVKEDEASGY